MQISQDKYISEHDFCLSLSGTSSALITLLRSGSNEQNRSWVLHEEDKSAAKELFL